MIRTLSLIVLALVIASCGVKRPLLRPKDIPAYEEQKRKKREELEQDQIELDREDAADAAAPESSK
ncbi:MAG: hypothetical protein SFW64_05025 [Alphaproteobacteria bacterium]|nr:hypothetical protein [Alphaproteobacteria bacterium]